MGKNMTYAQITAEPKASAAATLPAIDACQSGIFHELRSRENRILRVKPEIAGGNQRRLFLFRQHLNALFPQPSLRFS
jgi:hypothetical protein